ncbi:unnamed protein product [Cladocopium goreaui]|uniref:Calmodulin n=1 Tax=Cladocopium goreaui TaxID=2562237 RepID=A0A9P1G8Z6_9DINO|nr:unnamed protein product [Cladocopium goreaui]
MGSGGSSQAAKRAVSANTAEADQTEGCRSGIMPTAQEHTSPEVHSKLYDEIMSSIQLVFGHFSDGVRGLPAERLGQAMRILGMNPTEDQVYKHLADLGRPYIDQATFHRFIQDELTKYLEQVQAVVDYLKQYDTDNKGALSTEEVQAAIRGSELSQKKLQACWGIRTCSKGQLDIVELATCFLELSDETEMLEPSEAEKERASASEADSKAVEIQVVKDDVSADAEAHAGAGVPSFGGRQESASGPAAYSTMFSDVIASTNAVFRYFSQPSGVPTERLGHAMAILGMNPTEDEVKKHLAGLGGPKYIDQKMFHRFIEEELGKLIPKVQELLDYLKQFDTDGKGALSEEELQEVMRGSELNQDKVQARWELHDGIWRIWRLSFFKVCHETAKPIRLDTALPPVFQ